MLVEAGATFGRWTVESYYGKRSRVHCYNVVCACGKRGIVSGYELAKGLSPGCKSCGKKGHPLIGTKPYFVWCMMLGRCNNPTHQEWKNYGARGITVCEEWRDSSAFLDWCQSSGYREGLQLDRTDNNAGYSPDNCRWVDRKTNNRNKRTNRMLTAFGETKCRADWLDDPRCVVGKNTLNSRLRYGFDAERAISQPLAR